MLLRRNLSKENCFKKVPLSKDKNGGVSKAVEVTLAV